MDIALKATQLLVSRICHDLAGGISALSTGAELLAEEGGVPEDDALALIASSAQQSTYRLQFLRVAFGQGGGDGGSISMAALRTLTHGFLEGSRVSLVWSGDDHDDIPLGAGKLLLNMCLIGAEALPRGGVLDVGGGRLAGDGANMPLGLAVAAQGDGARLAPELSAAMAIGVDVDSLTPRTVHGHFTTVLAANLAAELEFQSDEDREVRIAALLPL